MIIDHAICSSQLLKYSETFYKVTGRIFLTNSDEIIKTYKKHANEFLVIKNDKWCYTHVFKMNINDYDLFNDIHLHIKESGLDIEHNYYAVLEQQRNIIDVESFDYWS